MWWKDRIHAFIREFERDILNRIRIKGLDHIVQTQGLGFDETEKSPVVRLWIKVNNRWFAEVGEPIYDPFLSAAGDNEKVATRLTKLLGDPKREVKRRLKGLE